MTNKFIGRNFLLTLNEACLEFYQDIVTYVTGLAKFRYMLVTEHIGQPNKHYHMYLQYDNTKHLAQSRLHGAHVEPCFGSAQQNMDYCWCRDEKHRKEGITAVLINEIGEVKLKGGNFSVGNLRAMESADELPAVLYNTYNKIKQNEKNRLSLGTWRKEVQVYYIQGPSAIGKSERAEEIIRNWYMDRKGIDELDEMYFDELKYCDGFYHGVSLDFPSEVAVFDDFRAGNMKPEEFINLIDYRVHNMNIKGGSIKNNYKLIIFTSVQRLSNIYRNVEEFERREQWERRINLVDMYPPQRVHIGGLPVGFETQFNKLEEVEVTDNWDDHIIIN